MFLRRNAFRNPGRPPMMSRGVGRVDRPIWNGVMGGETGRMNIHIPSRRAFSRIANRKRGFHKGNFTTTEQPNLLIKFRRQVMHGEMNKFRGQPRGGKGRDEGDKVRRNKAFQ